MFNRNFILLLVSNIILGASMPMLIILGALAGSHLASDQAFATLPPSIQLFAGMVFAAPVSMFMGRFGRRAGFLVGALLVITGGGLGALSLIGSNFLLLCLAHFCLGGALMCVGYIRFAAAEAVADKWKSTAISFTLASGLVAALVAPEIFEISKNYLETAVFAGAYLAVAALGLIGILPVSGLRLKKPAPASGDGTRKVDVLAVLKRKPVMFAIFAAAIAQAIMAVLMIPTPLAMLDSGFSETQAGEVIGWHVVAMFAPGFFTGWLINRFGPILIIFVGMALLAFSAIIAMIDVHLLHFYVSLILLGIGWNFGFTGGTYLLQTLLSVNERAGLQGINDTLISLTTTIAAFTSGALYAGLGWTAIAVLTLPVVGVAMVITLVIGNMLRRQPVEVTG